MQWKMMVHECIIMLKGQIYTELARASLYKYKTVPFVMAHDIIIIGLTTFKCNWSLCTVSNQYLESRKPCKPPGNKSLLQLTTEKRKNH